VEILAEDGKPVSVDTVSFLSKLFQEKKKKERKKSNVDSFVAF
jgi:hypothetical protein